MQLDPYHTSYYHCGVIAVEVLWIANHTSGTLQHHLGYAIQWNVSKTGYSCKVPDMLQLVSPIRFLVPQRAKHSTSIASKQQLTRRQPKIHIPTSNPSSGSSQLDRLSIMRDAAAIM